MKNKASLLVQRKENFQHHTKAIIKAGLPMKILRSKNQKNQQKLKNRNLIYQNKASSLIRKIGFHSLTKLKIQIRK
jgi:hypothetical protein